MELDGHTRLLKDHAAELDATAAVNVHNVGQEVRDGVGCFVVS